MKSNKYEDARIEKEESRIDVAMRILNKHYGHEKSPLLKNFENYEENLKCLQDVTDRVLDCMKGYGVSFKPEITDAKGKFSDEKLSAFVEKLLTIWADKQREVTYYTDPSKKGERLVEPFIRKRQELYSCCLYILMRCCLEKGAYTLVTGRKLEERTDFAFLLEQARNLMHSWCVMDSESESERKDSESEGKTNELLFGYDHVFGLHMYAPDLGLYKGYEVGFDSYPSCPAEERLAFLTDEGNIKRSQLGKVYPFGLPSSLTKETEEAAKADEADVSEEEMEDENSYETADGEDGVDNESGYETEEIENDEYFDYDESFGDYFGDYYAMDFSDHEYQAARLQEQSDREYLVTHFDSGEYQTKCERFVSLFKQAETEVLHDFCKDLEEIVTLYLIDQGIPPLMDTSKALDVYGSIYDEALQQAKRYERGMRWKTM